MLARGAPRLRLGAPLARIQSDLLGTVVYTDFISGRRDVCSKLSPAKIIPAGHGHKSRTLLKASPPPPFDSSLSVPFTPLAYGPLVLLAEGEPTFCLLLLNDRGYLAVTWPFPTPRT